MRCSDPITLAVGRVVPCGKCGNCIQRWITDWTSRLTIEQSVSIRSYFVTLTYERDPIQLYKVDLQRFFKRCRKVGFAFSYLAVGDYGDTYGRPHYHVLLFEKLGHMRFRFEDFCRPLWRSGNDVRSRGFVRVLPLSVGRMSYVVKYGRLAKLDWDDEDLRQKPFFLMSRRPALGASYLTGAMREYHLRGFGNWFFPVNDYKVALSRYYRDKLFVCPLFRKLHSLEVESEHNQVMEGLVKVGKGVEYVQRLINCSRLTLKDFRDQKRLKNKSL